MAVLGYVYELIFLFLFLQWVEKRKSSKINIIRGGTGSTWGQFLHGHAEWIKTRNLIAEIVDSCL